MAGDKAVYANLTNKTNGIWANISVDFVYAIAPFLDKLDAEKVGGYLVRLSSFEVVELAADPRLGDKTVDSDNDDLSDLAELIKEESRLIYVGNTSYNVNVWTFKSNPAVEDSDEDGVDDNIDPKPLISDVSRYELKNNFVSIEFKQEYGKNNWLNSDNSNVSYGGNQGWFKDEFSSYGSRKIFCNNEINGNTLASNGCGLISISDVLLYLSLYNKYSVLTNSNAIKLNSNGNIEYSDYQDFILYTSKYFDVNFNGVSAKIGMESLTVGYFKINHDNGNLKVFAGWGDVTPLSLYKTAIDKSNFLKSAKEMLEKDIPVTIGYDSTKPLSLYTYGNEQFVEYTTIKGHYMTLTGVLEYSDAAQKTFNFPKTMLEVSSWGEKYYIDYSDYKNHINIFTNMLYVGGF